MEIKATVKIILGILILLGSGAFICNYGAKDPYMIGIAGGILLICIGIRNLPRENEGK